MGELVFLLAEQTLKLEAHAVPKSKNLFIMFRDLTSGKETYNGGRYLDAELLEGHKVTLDFNKAYNPYCAYSPYSSCPVPRKEIA